DSEPTPSRDERTATRPTTQPASPKSSRSMLARGEKSNRAGTCALSSRRKRAVRLVSRSPQNAASSPQVLGSPFLLPQPCAVPAPCRKSGKHPVRRARSRDASGTCIRFSSRVPARLWVRAPFHTSDTRQDSWREHPCPWDTRSLAPQLRELYARSVSPLKLRRGSVIESCEVALRTQAAVLRRGIYPARRRISPRSHCSRNNVSRRGIRGSTWLARDRSSFRRQDQ